MMMETGLPLPCHLMAFMDSPVIEAWVSHKKQGKKESNTLDQHNQYDNFMGFNNRFLSLHVITWYYTYRGELL